jgi:hypothetical protein
MALNIDADVANSDWMRSRTWDLPTTVQGVILNIGVDRWEHFKTLPAYKAMPPHLAHDVDAYVKAQLHKTINKYSPDQERDEHGRFGSGLGSVTSEPEYKRINELTSKLPKGWTVDSTSYKFFVRLKNEDGTIQFETSEKDIEKMGVYSVTEALNAIDTMQEINPAGTQENPITFSIDQAAFAMYPSTYGYTEVGGTTIYLNPTQLGGAQGIGDYNVLGGFMNDVASNPSLIEYTVAHEWGHLLDVNAAGNRDALFEQINSPLSGQGVMGMSDYGKSNAYETIAEAYASWSLNGGNTSNPAVRLIAEQEGWQIGASQSDLTQNQLALVSKSESTYIYCSFDPEVQPVLTNNPPQVSKSASLNKYSPDQERDERGRFGAGSGSTETNNTDAKVQFVTNKINEKTTALESQGAKITSLQNQDELIEAFDSLEQLAEQTLNDPELGMNVHEAMEMDSGFTMTREALDHVEAEFLGNPDEVRTIALFDAGGTIAGATSLTMGSNDNGEVALNLNYLGTTGMVDGAGSALFGEAISFANEQGVSIQLHALDSEAYNFWVSMGFAHESGSTVFMPNEYLTMDSDTVANIAKGIK